MKPINQNLSINLDLIKNSELLYFFKPYMWKKTSYHFFCQESSIENTLSTLGNGNHPDLVDTIENIASTLGNENHPDLVDTIENIASTLGHGNHSDLVDTVENMVNSIDTTDHIQHAIQNNNSYATQPLDEVLNSYKNIVEKYKLK